MEDRDEKSFPLKDLEQIYIKKLADFGYEVQPHITRFASKLESADVGLTVIQSDVCAKYFAIKTKLLKNVIPDNDRIQLARKVVEPIRKEILAAHDMENHPCPTWSLGQYHIQS